MNMANLSGFSRGQYAIAAVLLLLIEIAIALFVHDRFVRPYLGDVLVVILIYCSVKSVKPSLPWRSTAIAVLMFAFAIEGLQYLKLVRLLGLQHNLLARTIIGTDFAWADMWCYVAGIALVWWIEFRRESSFKRIE
ncbi:MAG: DUF2809 domain-containing protein [Chitinophagaceae bacterium]|nr:DUF2809 domain-containing protein [Chitinophagaceae bacterium]